jgi:hypothetical protein
MIVFLAISAACTCAFVLGRLRGRASVAPEVARLERMIALIRLGHEDPESGLSGWRFKLIHGHIHAVPPEGGTGYFGVSMDYDSKTGQCSERAKLWVRPDGIAIPQDREHQIQCAYWAWFRQQVITGRLGVV